MHHRCSLQKAFVKFYVSETSYPVTIATSPRQLEPTFLYQVTDHTTYKSKTFILRVILKKEKNPFFHVIVQAVKSNTSGGNTVNTCKILCF